MITKIRQRVKDHIGETGGHLLQTYFAYGFIAVSIIVVRVLIARLYGQEALGIFTYFYSVVDFVFLFTSLGLAEGLAQIIIKDHSKTKRALHHLILAITPTTILFTGITLLLLTSTPLNPQIPYFGWAVVIYLIANTINYVTYNILRGYKKFAHASWYSFLNRLLLILFTFLIYLASWPFLIVLLGISLALFLSALAAVPEIKSLTPQDETGVNQKMFFSLAWSLFLVQISFYSLRFMDALVIKYLVDFHNLGLYSAHASITNVIRMVAYVFPVVVMPMAAVSRYKLRQSLSKILLLLIPFALVVLGATYLFVPLLYGESYKATILPLWLVFSSVLLVVYSYFNSVLVGENQFSKLYHKILIVDALLSLILNTLLTYVFILHWGIVGAPVATIVTLLVKIGLNLYGLGKLRNLSGKASHPSADHKFL